MRKSKASWEQLDVTMHDEARPMKDRVLACFYAFHKAHEETPEDVPEQEFTSDDVACYLGVEPAELVDAAIVELQAEGLIAGVRP